jgi:hypothetical protein
MSIGMYIQQNTTELIGPTTQTDGIRKINKVGGIQRHAQQETDDRDFRKLYRSDYRDTISR